jgi:hypothetical protein
MTRWNWLSCGCVALRVCHYVGIVKWMDGLISRGEKHFRLADIIACLWLNTKEAREVWCRIKVEEWVDFEAGLGLERIVVSLTLVRSEPQFTFFLSLLRISKIHWILGHQRSSYTVNSKTRRYWWYLYPPNLALRDISCSGMYYIVEYISRRDHFW